MALKSGNFGGDDFFTRAFAVLAGAAGRAAAHLPEKGRPAQHTSGGGG